MFNILCQEFHLNADDVLIDRLMNILTIFLNEFHEYGLTIYVCMYVCSNVSYVSYVNCI